MASGFGVNGGTGRCYQFWVDYAACIKTAETASTCADKREVCITQSIEGIDIVKFARSNYVLKFRDNDCRLVVSMWICDHTFGSQFS
jgi:hypothetical protein